MASEKLNNRRSHTVGFRLWDRLSPARRWQPAGIGRAQRGPWCHWEAVAGGAPWGVSALLSVVAAGVCPWGKMTQTRTPCTYVKFMVLVSKMEGMGEARLGEPGTSLHYPCDFLCYDDCSK